MPVNLKQAPRRELHFTSLDDILADVEAVTAGPHHTTGNHSATELVWHVAYFIDKAATGFGYRAPLPLWLLGHALKPLGIVNRPMKPGIRPPRSLDRRFWPGPSVTLDAARDYLRRAIAAAKEPGRMTHPSPVLGKLTHDQWQTLHCRHAEMHLSFIHPDPEP